MSFGGAVSSMITSIKNNKRNRKNTFEKLERFQKENNDQLHFNNTATKKELQEIKTQLKKENLINITKKGLLLLAVILLFSYLLL
ncbi:hypothetical protein RRF68_07490 [Tenacibaculum sp. HL-MS23]|uniref:hypothetical protein n=1 Tax=Tenacibaculum TaxID=104267 RepID=UPI001C4F5736|nr:MULTISPECIES: hypothetical protein [Tenacibaculum]QXP72795.1 hypothetical protein H0I30_08865 [Tenacibaculum sp. AHE14PA]QXP76709.1 hypothetical protein H0I31_03605 [Tenacibaculum sp. AHE15PA]WNW00840.1 hypothetical protein RRF68_07490 [Tenacibaculum sp. HL-MS23]